MPTGKVMNQLISIFLALLFSAFVAEAQQSDITVKLVSSVESVQPGQSFYIGAEFQIAPGWHVYWKNPGESGLPTDVKWTLSGGITPEPVEWPTPHRFTQAGDLIGYGYEGSLLLASEINPGKVAAGETITIEGQVSWLGCSPSLCVPGESMLKLALPVVEKSTYKENQLFKSWRETLPSDSPKNIVASLTGDLSRGSYVLTLNLPSPATTEINWFPALPDTVELVSEAVKKTGAIATIEFSLRAEAGAKLGSTFESIVAYRDQNGSYHGVVVPISYNN